MGAQADMRGTCARRRTLGRRRGRARTRARIRMPDQPLPLIARGFGIGIDEQWNCPGFVDGLIMLPSFV